MNKSSKTVKKVAKKFRDQKMPEQNGAKMLQPQKFFNHISV